MDLDLDGDEFLDAYLFLSLISDAAGTTSIFGLVLYRASAVFTNLGPFVTSIYDGSCFCQIYSYKFMFFGITLDSALSTEDSTLLDFRT